MFRIRRVAQSKGRDSIEYVYEHCPVLLQLLLSLRK
jgi:hypothetical protein